MAAREDAGGGGRDAANPGGGTGAPAPTRAAGPTVMPPVLGSPAYPPQPHHHHNQYYAVSPFGNPPGAPLPPYPTPSPFRTNFSATPASTRWSSKSAAARYAGIVLRALATGLSIVTVLLIPASVTVKYTPPPGSAASKLSLLNDSAFSCLLGSGVVAFVYSFIQLTKGIWEIAFKCNMFSAKATDYGTFIADMLLSYLLLSFSSVAAFGLHLRDKSHIHNRVGPGVWSLAKASVATSFLAFLVVACSSLLSGYRLCKRIIW